MREDFKNEYKSSDGKHKIVLETLKYYHWVRSVYQKSEDPRNLQELEVKYHSNRECYSYFTMKFHKKFKKIKVKRNICASGKVSHLEGACHGDSGGPLMALNMETKEYHVIGITSRGFLNKGCVSIIPNVFVKVSYFVPWIKKTLEDIQTANQSFHNFTTLLDRCKLNYK